VRTPGRPKGKQTREELLEKKKLYMREHRKKSETRDKNTIYKRDYRSNLHEDRRNQERAEDRIGHVNSRNSIAYIIASYEKGILTGPVYICICCGGLFFRRSVIEFFEKDCPKKILSQVFFLKNGLGLGLGLPRFCLEKNLGITFGVSVCPCVRLSVCPFVRVSVCPFVRVSVCARLKNHEGIVQSC
jgi:hypothetical protein